MKLPNNQMQALKLQKIRPLKRSLARLSRSNLFKALRSQPKQKPTASPKKNFIDDKAPAARSTGNPLTTSLKNAKQSKSVRIALNLLLVRPWVLLVGFWLLSLVGGTLALDGMLSPRKLKLALPEAPVIETPVATSQIQVTPDSDELAADPASDSEIDSTQTEVISIGADTNAADSGAGLPLLPVVILVGGCATGCLVMSRRRAMARMAAARARGRGRVRMPSTVKVTSRKPVRAAASTNRTVTTATPSNAAPGNKKRRQRVRKTAVGQPQNRSQRTLASRATAQPTSTQSSASQPRAAQSRTSQPRASQARASKRQVRRASSRIASRRQPIVSVVPANESHALDWNNNSLAHQMDIRTQRSAM